MPHQRHHLPLLELLHDLGRMHMKPPQHLEHGKEAAQLFTALLARVVLLVKLLPLDHLPYVCREGVGPSFWR